MISFFQTLWSELIILTAHAQPYSSSPIGEGFRQSLSGGIPFKSDLGLGAGCSLIPDGTFLACYISSLYVFFVRAAVILAVLMIVVGGLRWLLAVGDAGKIKDAKDIIISAITGLVLALISWVLFAQINSQLVSLRSIDITPINIPRTQNIDQYDRVTGGDWSLLNTKPGYCKKAGYVPYFIAIKPHPSELRMAEYQMNTFHPQLAEAITNVDKQVSNNRSSFGSLVYINSVSDGNIFASMNPCRRELLTGNRNGSCQHRGSYHYGGPQNECAFDFANPPLSCAIDLSVTNQDDYVLLQEIMRASGFPESSVWCEESNTNAKISECDQRGSKTVGHIHGEIPNCFNVISPSDSLFPPTITPTP